MKVGKMKNILRSVKGLPLPARIAYETGNQCGYMRGIRGKFSRVHF
jgi:hypothetical protein